MSSPSVLDEGLLGGKAAKGLSSMDCELGRICQRSSFCGQSSTRTCRHPIRGIRSTRRPAKESAAMYVPKGCTPSPSFRSLPIVAASAHRDPTLNADVSAPIVGDSAGVRRHPLSESSPSFLETTTMGEASMLEKHIQIFPHKDAEEVEKILDWLARFASAIRQAGARHRDLRAEALWNGDARISSLRDDTRDLLKSIGLSGLFRAAKCTAADLTQKVELPKLLHDRIIESNVKRRSRFLYAEHHDQKLRAASVPMRKRALLLTEHDIHETPSQTNQPEIQPKTSEEAPRAMDLPKSTVFSQPSTAGTPIDRAAYVPPPQQLSDDVPYYPPTKSEGSFVTGKLEIVYPPPPRVDRSSNFFTCPCCRQLLSKKVAEKRRWRYASLSITCYA